MKILIPYLLFTIVILLLSETILAQVKYAPTGNIPYRKIELLASTNKAATYNSDVYILTSPNYSVFAKWTETGATWAGNMKLQASLDGTNWEDIASTDVAMSGSGSKYWNFSDAGYLYGRAQIATYTSGSANLLLWVNTK
jgi:hypothetical protein